jgi:hypothetical protein
VRTGLVARRDGRLRCCDCASNVPHASTDNNANAAIDLNPERLRIIKLLAECSLSIVPDQRLVVLCQLFKSIFSHLVDKHQQRTTDN